MTPDLLKLAFMQWKAAHEAIHGELSMPEAELAYEIADFLVTCAQADAVADCRCDEASKISQAIANHQDDAALGAG